MGGVDLSDMMLSYYNTSRKTLRWYVKVFFHLLNICVLNANYLFGKYSSRIPKMSYLRFRNKIMKYLLGDALNYRVAQTVNASQHFAKKNLGREKDVVCAIQKGLERWHHLLVLFVKIIKNNHARYVWNVFQNTIQRIEFFKWTCTVMVSSN